MRAWLESALALLAVLTACATASAQLPAVPGAPVLPGTPVAPVTTGAGAVAAPAAPAAAPRNIWSFFMMTPEQKAQCKAHFCSSRFGMFANNMLVPAGAFTGGLLGPICPPPGLNGPGGANGQPNPADLAKPATSPEGAAAKIKQDEAQAKAKIAAIEFLATVDCRYYPEAEAGLITGLRAEKNECVRIAAAKAFVTGCCCSPKVIKALLTTVNCSNKDGFPAEASEVVRTYAYVALERCLRKCVEEEPELPPEPPPGAKKAMYEALTPMGESLGYSAHILLASYYPIDAKETPSQIYADARQALARGLKVSPQTVARMSGPKNVADAVFPESRSSFSLTLFTMPSFASIRKSAPPATSYAGPTWLPPTNATPAPPIAAPVVAQVPVQVPALASNPHTNTSAAPVTMPPMPKESPRTGRANLLHIFQDAFRR